MEIIEGMKMMNLQGIVREVVRISPTGSIIYAKNLNTSEIEKFRYYMASGKYIHKSCDELGENWRFNESNNKKL